MTDVHLTVHTDASIQIPSNMRAVVETVRRGLHPSRNALRTCMRATSTPSWTI